MEAVRGIRCTISIAGRNRPCRRRMIGHAISRSSSCSPKQSFQPKTATFSIPGGKAKHLPGHNMSSTEKSINTRYFVSVKMAQINSNYSWQTRIQSHSSPPVTSCMHPRKVRRRATQPQSSPPSVLIPRSRPRSLSAEISSSQSQQGAGYPAVRHLPKSTYTGVSLSSRCFLREASRWAPMLMRFFSPQKTRLFLSSPYFLMGRIRLSNLRRRQVSGC